VAAANICSSLIAQHPDHDTLAARLVVSNMHKETPLTFSEAMARLGQSIVSPRIITLIAERPRLDEGDRRRLRLRSTTSASVPSPELPDPRRRRHRRRPQYMFMRPRHPRRRHPGGSGDVLAHVPSSDGAQLPPCSTRGRSAPDVQLLPGGHVRGLHRRLRHP
jgi:hypothetical protein